MTNLLNVKFKEIIIIISLLDEPFARFAGVVHRELPHY